MSLQLIQWLVREVLDMHLRSTVFDGYLKYCSCLIIAKCSSCQ